MRFTAWLVLFATLLLWSGNWIFARAAREEIGPVLATVGRLILVLAILLPFTFKGLTGKLPLTKRRDWIVLASLGLAGGGPHLALQWLGLHYTTATSGILYLSVTPIFILLLAYAGWSYVVTRLGASRAGATLHLMPAMGVALSALFLGELPGWYHFAGIGLILTGTWAASTR